MGKKVIGYVGIMGIQDGVDVLLRAFGVLKNELGREDFLGVLIGNGPSVDDLKQLTRELGLEENVVFTGLVPFEEVPSYVAGFDICTTPDPINDYNNSCTTIKTMEYMALSKPTVSYKTIENCTTAADSASYVDSDCDPALFAKAIERLMDDPDLCQKLGQAGRERIESGLTWDHQKTELFRLYESFADISIRPSFGILESQANQAPIRGESETEPTSETEDSSQARPTKNLFKAG